MACGAMAWDTYLDLLGVPMRDRLLFGQVPTWILLGTRLISLVLHMYLGRPAWISIGGLVAYLEIDLSKYRPPIGAM